MRTTLFAIGAALLAVACGSSSISSGGGGNGTGDGGGSDGGCGEPPPAQCIDVCNGVTSTSSKECVEGAWVCPPVILCLADGGAHGGDGGIDCVTTTCNAATQYCNISGGGVQLPDAGSNMSYECLSLPTMPCDAGTGCACIPDRCGCTDDGGYITNECLYP